MFMEREEIRYGIKLGKIQFKYVGSYSCAFGLALLLQIFFGNYISIIVHNFLEVELDQIIEFSTGMGNCVMFYVIGFIIWGCMYKTNRTSQEIYPQTNKSRFVANILSDYIMIVIMTISSFLLNLSLFVMLPMIASQWGNAVVVDGLTMRDVLIITVVACGYGLLIQSMLLFIFSCIRKFKLWTISVPAICVAWFTYNYEQFFSFIIGVWGFYFQEPSFVLLVAKLILTHMMLVAISYLLEVHTKFHGDTMNRKQGIAFAIVVGIITIFNVVVLGNFVLSADHDTSNLTVQEGGVYESTSREAEHIVIDVSHLEEGTTIEIETSGDIELPTYEGEVTYYDSAFEHSLYLYYENDFIEDDLVVDGDELVLKYFMGIDLYNGVNVYSYIEPEITYELEENTLKIGYECTNPDVKILYVDNWIAGRYMLDKEVESGSRYEYYCSPASLYIQVD